MYILQIRCCSLWRPVVSSRCTNFWGHVLSPSYRIKNIDSAVPFETSLSVNYLTQNAEIYRKDLESYYCQWRRAGAQTFSWNPRTTPDVGFNTPFYGIFSTPPSSLLKVHNQPLWNMAQCKLYFLLSPVYWCAFYAGQLLCLQCPIL